jgi:hypothetical protein
MEESQSASQHYKSSVKLPQRFNKKTNETLSPGPGAYEAKPSIGPGSRGKSAPAFSFSVKHQAPKETHLETPGPGAYSQTDKRQDIGASAPAFTMSGRKEPKPDPNPTPGPGGYAHTVHLGEGPKFSMSTKLKAQQGSYVENPGPGAYEPSRPKSAPSHSMTGRPKDNQLSITPGPGAYNDADKRKDLGHAPSYSMRVKLESKHGSYIEVPGPGAYNGDPSRTKTQAAMYTMTGRPSDPKTAEVPGPGAYGQDASPVKPRSPSYSMRVKTAEPKSLEVPGPGAYSSNDLHQAPPSYSMAKKLESKHGTYIEVPGPGAYTSNVSPVKPHSPVFSLSSRMKPLPLPDNPGPGAYNATVKSVKTDAPSYTLGPKTALPKIEKFDIAFANPTSTLTGPKYTMRVKPKELKKDAYMVPGPGTYEQKSAVVTGPKYSMGPGLPSGPITQLLSSTV